MGFSPVEIGEMSMWQYMAALSGWNESQQPPDTLPTDNEFEDILEKWREKHGDRN